MFGSIRFFTKNEEDMEKLVQNIFEVDDWTPNPFIHAVDFTELLLTTDDDNLNSNLFDSASTAIEAVKELFAATRVTADYKVFYEGDYPNQNFTIVNGSKVQHYALSSYESVENTYQAIIDYIEDGDIYLGYFDETNYVEIGTYYKGKLINSRTVIIETDETGDDCYRRIDDEEYSLKLCSTDLKLAYSVNQFCELDDSEITEKCVDYFSDDSNARDEFLDECRDNSEDEIPDDVDMNEFTFAVIPLEKKETPAAPTAPSVPSQSAETTASAAGTVKCPNCGTENDAGMSFCETCGTKLAGSTVAQRAGKPSIEERMNKMQADIDAKLDAFFGKK